MLIYWNNNLKISKNLFKGKKIKKLFIFKYFWNKQTNRILIRSYSLATFLLFFKSNFEKWNLNLKNKQYFYQLIINS